MRARAVAAAVVVVASAVGGTVARESLALRHVALDLPGPPSCVVPADVDGDGRLDLAVVLAYSEVGSIGEDRIEDLVQVSVVIPAVFDRRELRVYRATENGYALLANPMELPVDVLHLEAGPVGYPLVAMRDDGLDAVRLAAGEDGRRLVFEPVFRDPSALARSKTFQPSLRLVHDLDGDGDGDVLYPSTEGVRVHLERDGTLATEPASTLDLPGSRDGGDGGRLRTLAWPRVRHVDGDGRPDLVLFGGRTAHVLLANGDGTFRPVRPATRDCHDEGTDVRLAGVGEGRWPWPEGLSDLRDLDGDGRAEAVLEEELERPGGGMRAELKDAKRPRIRYAFHRLDDALDVRAEPFFEAVFEGHDLDVDDEGELPTRMDRFVDLDGDGREDLVTVTLDFSILQAIRILATKRISIGVDFHVYHQEDDGTFREVEGLDLSEKLKLDLNDLTLGRFAQFAGDFDGDGRQDFVHFGRGKRLTIHRGGPGATYPKKPDLSIDLEEEPEGLDLIRVEDLDGDGRADIRITRPLPATDPDETPPVRVDLYLSGDAP